MKQVEHLFKVAEKMAKYAQEFSEEPISSEPYSDEQDISYEEARKAREESLKLLMQAYGKLLDLQRYHPIDMYENDSVEPNEVPLFQYADMMKRLYSAIDHLKNNEVFKK